MKLYIQVENGETVNHPATETNLLQAFPDGIPSNWEPFVRKPDASKPNIYQKSVCTYVKNNDTWEDSWSIVNMTDEEKAEKTKFLEDNANNLAKFRTEQCTNMLYQCQTQSEIVGVQLWTVCLTAHQNWVLESVNPVTPPFPIFPRRDMNQEWFQPDTTVFKALAEN
jgi:hypothetical protein